MSDIPVSSGCDHKCGAIRHIEDLSHDVDELRRELRSCERHHAEDIRKLWVKVAVITAAIVTFVPTGWNYLLGVI